MTDRSKLVSYNPFTNEAIGSVGIALSGDVESAFVRSKAAQLSWARLPRDERIAVLRKYASILEQEKSALAKRISAEAGKPLWESATEVTAMINKVEISIEADAVRCGEFTKGTGVTRFHPLGVVGVLGPFNFPGHLPNGHIIPALLAGNAVLFKPSEQTPLVGAKMVELLHLAGVPQDVVQVLYGTAETGRAVVELKGLRGLFFTGSAKAGLAIHRALAGRPQTLLALEMGGNNPFLVDEVSDLAGASRMVCQSAFVTSGQRCTCARRLLVPAGEWGDQFLKQLIEDISLISVGDPLGDEDHYLGTVISEAAASAVYKAERALLELGARSLIPLDSMESHPASLRPALVDVSEVAMLEDEECFGPLLQVIRYGTLDEAIQTANATAYGLAAGIITESPEVYKKFYADTGAGIINLNTPLTGASSASPFGGIGLSGNYRPSAYFAADYCAYPTASMENHAIAPACELPGFPLKQKELS